MNYTTLIREAWATTWRYRFLWVLGLLAGATGGTMSLGRSSLPEQPTSTEWAARTASFAQQAEAWIAANVALVAGLALAVVVFGALLAILSVIARGGITQATVDLQAGQPSSLGHAWRAGRHWFWRFLGLLVLLGVLAGAVVGAILAALANLGAAGAIIGAIALTVGVVASIVLSYAERAIVVHDLGPIAALRHGWSVFADHLSASFLAWIVSVVLSVAVGVLAVVSVGSLLMLFGGVGVAVWMASGLSPALIVNAGIAGAAVIALLVAMAAVANTFFWNYWTLAYLRLDPPVTA